MLGEEIIRVEGYWAMEKSAMIRIPGKIMSGGVTTIKNSFRNNK